MKLRILAAAALTAAAATLTSCSGGTPATTATETAAAPAASAATTASSPAPETAPTQGNVEISLPADGSAPSIAGMTLAGPDPSIGQPIPDAELADSRTAKQIRFIAGRLDAYIAANGVPSDWVMNGFDYISTTYTQEEDDAWDKEVNTSFMGRPDGGYSLRGWSLTGADPKYDSHNNGLEYDSAKGFIRG